MMKRGFSQNAPECWEVLQTLQMVSTNHCKSLQTKSTLKHANSYLYFANRLSGVINESKVLAWPESDGDVKT